MGKSVTPPTFFRRSVGDPVQLSPTPIGDPVQLFRDPCELHPATQLRARAHVTDRISAGTVWMRDGWEGLNTLTSGEPVLPDAAVDLFEFSSGQAEFDAHVEVEASGKG